MKLGLLGGTFDPIHRGHIAVARTALATGLERVVLVPARRPPHKPDEDLANPFHRFAMAAIAIVGEPGLTVSPVELARDEPSYTILTLRRFLALDHEVTLIMGTDSLADLETWRDVDEILMRAAILAYPRNPWAGDDVARRLPARVRDRIVAKPGGPGTISILEGVPEEISSSTIRERLGSGRPVADLLPTAVADYIARNGLYGPARPGALPGE